MVVALCSVFIAVTIEAAQAVFAHAIKAIPFLKRSGVWAAVVGLVALATGFVMEAYPFRSVVWSWLGPLYRVEMGDHYPILPWSGFLLLGVAFGWLIYRFEGSTRLPESGSTRWWVRAPALLGRHSLAIYLVHQPILLGLLYVFGFFRDFG